MGLRGSGALLRETEVLRRASIATNHLTLTVVVAAFDHEGVCDADV